jgi:hypothetical protein
MFIMKLLVIITLLIIALIASTPTTAQTPAPAKCDTAAVFDAAAKLKATGDNAKDLAALVELREQITALNIACAGHTFSGKTIKVVAPFELPAGLWVWRGTGSGLEVKATVLEGQCIGSLFGGLLDAGKDSSLWYGLEQERSHIVTPSEGCQLSVSIKAKGDFTVTVERLK